MSTNYTEQELGALSAAEAAASQWLVDAGYTGATDDECACITDKARADEARGMVMHWVSRCDLPEHLAKAITDKLAWGGNDFLAAFPQTMTDYHTGGGCMAWKIALPDGTHLLLTGEDGSLCPDTRDTSALIGHYHDADGSPVTGECDLLEWPEAIKLVRERIDIAVEDAAAAVGFGLVPDESLGDDTLHSAMVALYEELSNIELDIAELGDREPAERAEVAAIYWQQHAKLAQFFDHSVIA